jgi:hypothetical protein
MTRFSGHMEAATLAYQDAVLLVGGFPFGFGPLSGLDMVYQSGATCMIQRYVVFIVRKSTSVPHSS